MTGTLRTFGSRVSEEGMAGAILAAAEYTSPTPLQERLSLTREFKRQSLAPGERRSGLSIWYHGFTPKSCALYDLETYDPDQYISDLDERYCWEINQPYAYILEDKDAFHHTLRDHGYRSLLPRRFGRVANGSLDVDSIATLLRREGSLVLKPRAGAGGGDVYFCEITDERPRINGGQGSWSEFKARLGEFEGYLVTEYCQQAKYAEKIYPETPNTIRILTMNPREGSPFVARAVHRVGSDVSGVVDNFSRGGLSAEVTEGGVLGPAVRYLHGDVSWHEVHPDSGMPIDGVKIPGWSDIRESVRSIAADIPEFRYVGWDVLCTEEGPKILEGNSNTDTDLIQAHGPLLTDDRVRTFYREHGIVR